MLLFLLLVALACVLDAAGLLLSAAGAVEPADGPMFALLSPAIEVCYGTPVRDCFKTSVAVAWAGKA